ncbi:MAG: hypothetical protein M1821_004534 [Bathelium mastoideum]|nr:MAG: hypothetical protein M1821_004534 [Bathelium mastoideum]
MEGLAVTAGALGVASFAKLVVQTVGEIHAFYSSIKEAPLMVTTILADLNLLITILQDSAYDDTAIATCDTLALDKARSLCRIKVRNLQTIVQELERGFASRGKRQKLWAAWKTSRKKEKLEEFRSSLEDTKITLLLALFYQKNKTQSSNVNGQENTRSSRPLVVLSRRIGDAPDFIGDPIADAASHRDVIELVNSEPQPTTGEPGLRENEALDNTLDYDAKENEDSAGIGSRLASSKASAHTNNAVSEKSPALEVADHRACGNAKQFNSAVVLCEQFTPRKSERFAGQQALAMQRKLATESRSRLKRSIQIRKYCSRPLFQSDILGSLYEYTQWTKTTVSITNDVSEKSEVTTSIIYHPGRWQIACGFATVLNFSLYDPYPLVTPKRAVPDGALVFDLCFYGNIDAVRLLFERGEASVLDYAVGGAQYEMAKYLLLHGADPEAQEYGYSQL